MQQGTNWFSRQNVFVKIVLVVLGLSVSCLVITCILGSMAPKSPTLATTATPAGTSVPATATTAIPSASEQTPTVVLPTDTTEPSAASNLSPEEAVNQIAQELIGERYKIRTAGIDTADGASVAFVNYSIDPSVPDADALQQSLDVLRAVVPRITAATDASTIEIRSFRSSGERVLGIVMNVTLPRNVAEKTNWQEFDMRTIETIASDFTVGPEEAWGTYKQSR